MSKAKSEGRKRGARDTKHIYKKGARDCTALRIQPFRIKYLLLSIYRNNEVYTLVSHGSCSC